MKELITTIAKALVDSPNAVEVEEIKGNFTTVYEIRGADGEAGMLIGKRGATVNAIRQIIYSVASKAKRRVSLEIIE